MSLQVTKRCHWVPQAYLRAFAADPGAKLKIWRLGKDHGDPELKPISKVTVSFHLYVPKAPNGRRDDKLEKKLASLEKWLGTSVWKDVCTDFPDFAWKPLRQMLALLISTTYLRNPSQLENTKRLHRYLIDLVLSGPRLPDAIEINGTIRPICSDGWEAYRDATENDVQSMWVEQIDVAGWLAQILLDMRWSIVCSEEPVFITSDNPVMVLHPSLRFRGFRNPETFVVFPLSPTRVLIMDNRQDETDGLFYALKDKPGCWNGLIWRNSIKHMFAPRHPDLVCAEIMADSESMDT